MSALGKSAVRPESGRAHACLDTSASCQKGIRVETFSRATNAFCHQHGLDLFGPDPRSFVYHFVRGGPGPVCERYRPSCLAGRDGLACIVSALTPLEFSS